MQKYTDNVVNKNGAAISGASVTVRDAAGNLATLYSDDGVTTQANPVSTDAKGVFSFYAADGTYTVTVTGSRIGTSSKIVTLISEASVATYAALRAFAGTSKTVNVTGYLASAAPSGIAGIFTCDDADTTSTDNGGTIIVASNGKRWKRVFSGAVHVTWFGAKGDGATDDSTAILAAVATGIDVYFPQPTAHYATTQAIAPSAEQVLFGDGISTQILCTGTNTNAISIAADRVVVRDLFVKYTGTSSSGVTGAAIFIGEGSSYCQAMNNRLEGARAGVTIYKADDNTVHGNLITSTTLTSPEQTWDIGIYLGGSRNRITENRCFSGGYVGVQAVSDFTTACDRNTIHGNFVSAHTGYGIVVYSNQPGGTADKNIITSNHIWDISGAIDAVSSRAKGAGIYAAGAEGTVIVGNELENCNIDTDAESLAPGAIGINGCSSGVVQSNIIKTANYCGIYAVTQGAATGTLLIGDNEISDCTNVAIRVKNMSNVSVCGNAMDTGSSAGILITHSGTATGIKVAQNTARDFAEAGVRVENAQGADVVHNTARDCVNGFQIDVIDGGDISHNKAYDSSSNDFYIGPSCTGVMHFDRNTARSTATNGVNANSPLFYGNNDVAGQTSPYTGTYTLERALPNGATPDVLGAKQCTYAGATAITDLLSPIAGQELVIRATDAVTISHNAGATATRIFLNGGVNFSMAVNNTLTLYYPQNGPWFEKSRKT